MISNKVPFFFSSLFSNANHLNIDKGFTETGKRLNLADLEEGMKRKKLKSEGELIMLALKSIEYEIMTMVMVMDLDLNRFVKNEMYYNCKHEMEKGKN